MYHLFYPWKSYVFSPLLFFVRRSISSATQFNFCCSQMFFCREVNDQNNLFVCLQDQVVSFFHSHSCSLTLTSCFLISKLLHVKKTKAFSCSISEIESHILPFVAFLFTVPTASTFLQKLELYLQHPLTRTLSLSKAAIMSPLFSFLPSFDPRSRSCRAAASISFVHFPCHYRGSGLWYYGHRPLMQPASFKLAG